jgi:ABC-type multidrug transport system fused ATPase/permease subunit
VISVIRLTSKMILTRIAIAAKTTARVTGFERLMNFSLQWHARENSGNKMQRIFTGSDSIPEWAFLVQNSIFLVATNFIGTLGFFLFKDPVFTFFLLTYMTVFFTIERIFNRKMKALSNKVNQYREKSSGKYMEGAGNILAIKALGAEKDINLRMSGSEEDFKDIQITMANTGTNKWYCFQTVSGISTSIFLLLVGRQYLSHSISIGDILVFFTYFWKLREATSNVTDISAKVIQLRSDLLRMMPIFLENLPVKTGTDDFPAQWDVVSIQDGCFKYSSGQVGIKGLNFSFKKGEKIGIAGPSGSGKSTLVKVLLGLYALESGAFKIGEKDYYAVSHEEVMKNISIVLQETELFNLSLRENLTLSRDVDPALFQKAIDIACLQDVIDRLPEGIGTFVGERGYALSGGERQRIGIARAICKNAPIILLDEATAALDSKTEKTVMDGLLTKLGADQTFIIIAHRISTLRGTDRVVVFNKGDVHEEGVYAQLIENRQSHLGQLYALQSEG